MTSKEFTAKFLPSDSNNPGNILQEAFQALIDIGDCKCVWITQTDCLQIKCKDKSTIFVLDKFGTPAFDHLLSVGTRIYGPLCILHCMKNNTGLPKAQAICNLAMSGLVVSCSSLNKETRDRIHKQVQWMNGEVSRDFHHNVTHLVTGEVGSKKYLVAASLRKQIMATQWVESVWEDSQSKLIHANDPAYVSRYSCPVFLGLVITVSGLDTKEREHVREMIQNNGGQYSGEMKLNECTHLVLRTPCGQKYEFAKKYKIHTIDPKWIKDCLSAGYCLEEHPYKISGELGNSNQNPGKGVSTSTPTSLSRRGSFPAADVSSINMTRINETGFSNQLAISGLLESFQQLLAIDLSEHQRSQCFRGCKIYLTGLNLEELTKSKKLVNYGGGFRFDTMNEMLTHVVVGRYDEGQVKMLKALENRPEVVTVQWLIDCVLACEAQPTVGYVCLDWDSEKFLPGGFSSSSRRESTATSGGTVTPFNNSSTVSTSTTLSTTNSKPMPDGSNAPEQENSLMQSILEQYMDQSTLNEAGGLFSGRTFNLAGFSDDNSEALKEIITSGGGKVSGNHSVDFLVVPIFGCQLNKCKGKVVTNTWLQTCMEDGKLLPEDANPLFKPLTQIQEGLEPLKDCVISVSGYAGAERDTLLHIAELLGARCQDYFVRRPIADRNLLANTHLVASAPEGSKYEAALKWDIHTIGGMWLVDCAKKSRKLPEEQYPLTSVSSTEGSTMETSTCSEATGAANSTKSPGPNEPASSAGTKTNHSTKPCAPDEHVSIAGSSVNMEMSDTTMDVRTAAFNSPAPATNNFASGKASLENIDMVKTSTPFNNRVQQLRTENKTPYRHKSNESDGWETPSKILTEGVFYNPDYSLEEAYAAVDNMVTPAASKHRRTSSLPLDEYAAQQLDAALVQLRDQLHVNTPKTPLSQRPSITDESPAVYKLVCGKPLAGLVVYVAKKLTKKQAEYNNLCASLGADYKWTYDQSCTHLIYQGKKNDINKEFRLARDQKKFIVSPSWLLACKEENRRVDESAYPHTLNPQMALALETVATPHTRPATRSNLLPLDNSGKENITATKTATEINWSTSDESSTLNLMRPPPEENKGEAKEQNSTCTGASPQLKPSDDVAHKKSENTGENFALSLNLLMQQGNATSPSLVNLRRPASRTRTRASATSLDEPGLGRSSSSSGEQSDTRKSPIMKSFSKKLDSEQSQKYDVVWEDPLHRNFRPQGDHNDLQTLATGLASSVHGMMNDGEEDDATDATSSTTAQARGADRKTSDGVTNQELSQGEGPAADPDSLQGLLDSEMMEAPSSPRVFLLSGLQPAEKDDYAALIDELGGQVLDSVGFDQRCTHLVVEAPSRNEKFLACVAAGKWILHKSYLEASRQNHAFANETDYEWGSGTTMPLLEGKAALSRLALAANRWRRYVQEKHSSGQLSGAFRGWRALLMVDKRKEESFGRVLGAGGAELLNGARMPSDLSTVSHAFIDMRALDAQGDLVKKLKAAGVHCCRPEYISDYLNEDPPPAPELHYIQIPNVQKRSESSQLENGSMAKRKRNK